MATGRFVKQPESALQQMLDANVYHFAAMLKKFLPQLCQRNRASGVIVTASLATLTPLANNAPYHASKVFESYLCYAIQNELKRIKSKVELLVANPSFVRTELLGDVKAPSLFVVGPADTCKSTLACLGHDERTYGSFIHEIQSYPTRFHAGISQWVVEKITRTMYS